VVEDIKEAKTEDLMTEAERLQDKIENIECYTAEDRLRLVALYAEIECRGIGVVELYTIRFVDSPISSN